MATSTSTASAAATASLPARGGRPPAYERTAGLAIADIQAYWARTFPRVYGAKYQAIPS